MGRSPGGRCSSMYVVGVSVRNRILHQRAELAAAWPPTVLVKPQAGPSSSNPVLVVGSWCRAPSTFGPWCFPRLPRSRVPNPSFPRARSQRV